MTPDLVLYGGKIITLGPQPGVASAVVVSRGRIVFVGDDARARARGGPGTRFIHLEGRTAVPGFIDGHTHVAGIGEKLQRIPLGEIHSLPQLLHAVEQRARSLPKGQWILGNGEYELFHEDHLAERRLPTVQELDAAAPEHPVYLTRCDDAALVNTKALELTGIADDTAGKLTNILMGRSALALVKPLLPVLTEHQRVQVIREMMQRYHAAGVTSVVDCGLVGQFAQDWAAYERVHADYALQLRVNLMVRLNTDGPVEGVAAQIEAVPHPYGHGDNWLRVGTLKLIFDGEISTAWMRQPYPQRPDDFGRAWIEPKALREILAVARGRTWPVAIHTMGGAAIDCAIDAFAGVFPHTGRPLGRHSLMHVFFPSADNLRMCRTLGIVLSVHPLIFYVYGRTMIREWGPDVAAAANPLRDLLDSGAMVGGGTDMVRFDPLLSMWTASTRTIKSGETLGPHQAITTREALWLHTLGAARITGEEQTKGSIEVGKLADIVVLSDDPLSAPPDALKDIAVLLTIVGGVVVYDTRGTGAPPAPGDRAGRPMQQEGA